MKKITIALGIISACFSGYSQGDTVRVTDFALLGSAVLDHEYYNLTEDEIPELGENITWDYSGYVAGEEDETTLQVIKEMSEAPNPSFAGANMVNHVNNEEWFYINRDESGVYIVGYDDGSDVYNMNMQYYPSELYYGSYDSIASTFMRTVMEGVGYGTLITPEGTFPNLVLMRTKSYDCDGSYCELSQISYTWFMKNTYFECPAQLHYFVYDNTVEFAWSEFVDSLAAGPQFDTVTNPQDTTGTGGEEQIGNETETTVIDVSNINNSDYDYIEIFTIRGELLISENNNGSFIKSNVLTSGVYIFKLYKNSKFIGYGKFVK